MPGGLFPMRTVLEWYERNRPSEDMFFAKAAEGQVLWFGDLSKRLGVPNTVVGRHTSKSIDLPVVRFDLVDTRFHISATVRDNFHDINVKFEIGVGTFDLSLTDIYPQATWEWYCEQVESCAGYSWKGWSEDEINDPRITRVEVTHENGSTYWKSTEIERKERWIARWQSPEWYSRDWSSGTILYEGEFGPEAKLVVAYRPFAQGIKGPIEDYKKGCSHFTVATNREGCERLVALMKERYACKKGRSR